MNQEYIIEKFTEILPVDFKLTISDEFIMNFEHLSLEKSFLIFVGNSKKLQLSNILARLVFNDIELLLNKNFKLGENNSTINIKINKHLFNTKIGEGILDQLPISLATEEGVNKACQLIEQYIKQDAIPFFNYWQDIRDFLPFLETDDSIFINKMFIGNGVEKKIIIWKLCSHPKYSNYIVELIKSYEDYLSENPKDKWAIKDYKFIQKLLKTLEKTNPLYAWDDAYLLQKKWANSENRR